MANPKGKPAKKQSRAAKEKQKPRKASDLSARSRSTKGALRGGTFGRGANPERVKAILRGLDEAYPASTTALKHDNAFQLLISTILSAQSTDQRVNMVTPGLFKKYPTPAALAYANPNDIEQELRNVEAAGTKTLLIAADPSKIDLLSPAEIEPALKAGRDRAVREADRVKAFWA